MTKKQLFMIKKIDIVDFSGGGYNVSVELVLVNRAHK